MIHFHLVHPILLAYMFHLLELYNYMILLNTGDGTQIYCYNQLGYVGKDVLSDVAYQIYTDLDEFVESFKSYMSNYSGE